MGYNLYAYRVPAKYIRQRPADRVAIRFPVPAEDIIDWIGDFQPAGRGGNIESQADITAVGPFFTAVDRKCSYIRGGIGIGKGKGNDAATILGAILGADMANKKSSNKTIVGYKRSTVCKDSPTYVTETKNIYSHSTIRFADGNRQYDIKFIDEDK